MSKGTVLIHHDGALGDVLLSLPCIHLIRDGASRIHFIGRPDVGRLLLDSGLVEEMTAADAEFYSSLYTEDPDPAVETFLLRFNRAYVFSIKERPAVASRLQDLIPDTKAIKTIPEREGGMHVSDFRLHQLPGPHNTHSHLPVPGVFREKALHLLQGEGYDGQGKVVAVHPGSGSRKKNWPLHNFLELAMRLLGDRALSIVFLCGPAEDDDTKAKIRLFSEKLRRVFLLDREDLTTVAAVLSLASLYIGNDSGISHLAAAVHTPSLVLFGPTDPRLWGPAGVHVRILYAAAHTGSLDDLGVERVEKVLAAYSVIDGNDGVQGSRSCC